MNAPILQESIDCENDPCEGEDAEEVRIRSNDAEYDEGSYGAAYGTEGIIEEWLQVRESGLSGLNDQSGPSDETDLTRLIHDLRNLTRQSYRIVAESLRRK